MPNYNNTREKTPTCNTYTPIAFVNENAMFSINYFNRMMNITIMPKTAGAADGVRGSFDKDAKIDIYISAEKAKLLHDSILEMLNDSTKHNVCIETRTGLFMVSDGKEFGKDYPVFVIFYAHDGGHINSIMYNTSPNHSAAFNYDVEEQSFETKQFPDYEIQTLLMVLDQYWRASAYAYAAANKEANMYMTSRLNDTIRAIAGKVGIEVGGKYNSSSQFKFLSGSNSNQSNSNNSSPVMYGSEPAGATGDYESAAFDDIFNAMGSSVQ